MASNNKKGVEQVDLDGNVVNTFESASMAARETGISRSYISMCCGNIPSRVRGATYPKTTAGGYVWRFTDGE